MFYSDLNSSIPVFGFSASRPAGEREIQRVTVHSADYDKSVYYALVAIDKDGNVGEPSNVRQAYVPSPETAATLGGAGDSSSSPSFSKGPDHRIVTSDRPGKILLYIVVGIVAFIVFCVVLVLLIVVTYRRKKHLSSSQTDLSSNSIGVNANTTVAGGGADTAKNGADFASPGFAVCDEHELNKETNGFLSTYSDFTSSNVGDFTNSSSQNNAVSYATDGNAPPGNLDSSTYGWTEYNNPYVNAQLPLGNTLPTYRTAFSPQTTYAQQQISNSMYARPVPKSQRALFGGSAGMLNSTPQSPIGVSSYDTTGSSSGAANNNNALMCRQNLIFYQNNGSGNSNPPAASGSSSNSSGDDRVPSISPPPMLDGAVGVGGGGGGGSVMATASEQTRLIGSASNTPTKSILKKPKHQQQPQNQSLMQHEDQSSQSSKDERLSESSNVSFSDRETPTTAKAEAIPEAGASVPPDYSPSNTYLETSFDVATAAGGEEAERKVPPPTLPKPKLDETGDTAPTSGSATLERRIRNITQV